MHLTRHLKFHPAFQPFEPMPVHNRHTPNALHSLHLNFSPSTPPPFFFPLPTPPHSPHQSRHILRPPPHDQHRLPQHNSPRHRTQQFHPPPPLIHLRHVQKTPHTRISDRPMRFPHPRRRHSQQFISQLRAGRHTLVYSVAGGEDIVGVGGRGERVGGRYR